jgi:hypothetical protein
MPFRSDCTWIVLLATSLAFAGCSFVLTTRAPPRDEWPTEHAFHKDELKSCTTSPGLPLLDGAIALASGVGAIYVAGRGGDGDANGTLVGVLFVPVTIIYLASALYGVAASNTCGTYLAGPPYAPAPGR